MSEREAPMMQVGGVTKEAIEAAAESVVRVATCSPVPEVAVAALATLAQLGETKNITISGCSLTSGVPSTGVAVLGSDHHFEGDR